MVHDTSIPNQPMSTLYKIVLDPLLLVRFVANTFTTLYKTNNLPNNSCSIGITKISMKLVPSIVESNIRRGGYLLPKKSSFRLFCFSFSSL